MLILTEKPSVAKDFAKALGCHFYNGVYVSSGITITNCIGHLFELEEPSFYGEKFKSWSNLPIIPENICYRINENVKSQAKLVISLLKKHASAEILIATDADREGEIIARECLLNAGITDFSRIKRFWISQALTTDVIKDGMKNAKPLSNYNTLAEQGFSRQKADWLCGINFTRFITTSANRKLPVGRVQMAILSAIAERCNKIKNFKSEKYFEHYATFSDNSNFCTGIYFENEKTGFPDKSKETELQNDIGQKVQRRTRKTELKTVSPPQLYNLNALQKEAYSLYGLSAAKTLNLVQSLYETHKCVSYPRTPSRVMGSGNVELCKSVFNKLLPENPKFSEIAKTADISLGNKRVFNDAKLEAHHALIPLAKNPSTLTDDELKIYKLITERFFVTFAENHVYEKLTAILEVNNHTYKVTGKAIKESGWKKFDGKKEKSDDEEEEQELPNIDWDNLKVTKIETKEKMTKPPKYFNEASILSFMENPKSLDENRQKLVGLGTAATRHTFVPKLKAASYIEIEKKNIICTELGYKVLEIIGKTPVASLCDIAETTSWEEKLDANPESFLDGIKTFVRNSVSTKIETPSLAAMASDISCPVCNKQVRKGKSNWYCTGYKDGCNFKIWETISGTRLTEKDVKLLCAGKQTGEKKCTSKGGKEFTCKFALDEKYEVKFVFSEKKKFTT